MSVIIFAKKVNGFTFHLSYREGALALAARGAGQGAGPRQRGDVNQ